MLTATVKTVVENASALHLIVTGDPALFSIVGLSLRVSLSATLLAALLGAPLGALVALTRFRGREIAIVSLNAMMGLNQYGVMLVNPRKHPNVEAALGQEFIDYLISPEGQKAIANYRINGQQLFFPDADDPSA